MNPIARDLASLRRATRDVELDEREAKFLEDAGSRWNFMDIDVFCTLLEYVREAGFLVGIQGGLLGTEEGPDRLQHALRGVILDDHESRFVEGMRIDPVTVGVVSSLFEKVRLAGHKLGVQGYAPATERDRHVEPGLWGETGSGPGV